MDKYNARPVQSILILFDLIRVGLAFNSDAGWGDDTRQIQLFISWMDITLDATTEGVSFIASVPSNFIHGRIAICRSLLLFLTQINNH